MVMCIYALVDPITNEIRYIGKTVNSRRRFNAHLQHKELTANTKKADWLRELVNVGLKPKMIILEGVNKENWNEREQYWIKHYRSLKYNLTNITDGGAGVQGMVHSKDTRRKMSESRKGRSLSDECKEKIGKSNKGKLLGRRVPEEVKRKISKALKGKKPYEQNDQIKLKISKALIGYKHTGEARKNMSIGIADSWTRRNARSDSISGIRGVTYRGSSNDYRVRVTMSGIRVHLGYVKTIEEAKEMILKCKMQNH